MHKMIGHYAIRSAGTDYVVHNTHKKFDDAHTHIRHLKGCEKVIHCALANKTPHDMPDYLLVSIARITDHLDQKEYIEQLLKTRRQKGKKEPYRRHA